MEPWHKIVRPRSEVREGRSSNPDEIAIHLEQAVSGAAPDNYKTRAQIRFRHSTIAASEVRNVRIAPKMNG